MMQTLKHWRCTDKVCLYTLTSPPPISSSASVAFIHNSYTVVCGYPSPGRPVLVVPIVTGCCLSANGISVSMVTGCTRANLKGVCSPRTSCILRWNDICHRSASRQPGDSSKYGCWHFTHFRNGGMGRSSRVSLFHVQ